MRQAFRPPSAARHSVIAGAALLLAGLAAAASLTPVIQTLRQNPALQAVFFRPMQVPGAVIDGRRPPAETRPALTRLIAAEPANAELHRLRASESELAMDYPAAEAGWRQYSQLTPDKSAGSLALADFYHRRLRPLDEVQALDNAARLPAPAAETLKPAPEQTSWKAFQCVIAIVREQALSDTAAIAQYRAWAARYPKEPEVRKLFIHFLVERAEYTLAGREIQAYRFTFPTDEITPVEETADLELHRGTAAQALAVYDRAFRPLMPDTLFAAYYQLLEQHGRLRDFVGRARADAQTNREDLSPPARLYHYFFEQKNLPAAARVLIEYRARKKNWTPDELAAVATLLQNTGEWNEAARCWYALYSLPKAPAAARERALAGLSHILLNAADEPVRFGSADLSYYKDIATMDTGPGFLNGILSLILNSSNPRYHYDLQNRNSWPYFHRAEASELVELLAQQFPASPRVPELRASLIEAYAGYNETDAVVRAATRFLSLYLRSPLRTQVALALADAYSRLEDTRSEFAVYDQLLKELAANASGVPLGEAVVARLGEAAAARLGEAAVARLGEAAVARLGEVAVARLGEVAAAPPAEIDAMQYINSRSFRYGLPQPNEAENGARSPDYARVLDRYIARLVSLKRLPDAIQLYAQELARNPNDPGLYERLAAFLDQNHFGDQIEQVYKRAVAQFQNPGWTGKLARWYLRQHRDSDFAQLTRSVADQFAGAELERYFRQIVAPASVDAALYLQLNLYARQQFPNDLVFVQNLLAAYRRPETANPAAWQALLRQYWFYDENMKNALFAQLATSGRLQSDLDSARAASANATGADPAAVRFVAEGEAWRSHFEAAAPAMRTVALMFPADRELMGHASDLYRSLGAYDPANTLTAATLAETEARSDPRDREALARVGDIFADRDWLTRARPWWDRMAAIEPGNAQGYLDAATVFWDYYRYDDALRLIAEGRRKLADSTLFAYEAGAVYEGKRNYAAAIAEYAKAPVAGPAAQRLRKLAEMPAHGKEVDRATLAAVAAPHPTDAAIELRAAVLEAQKRPADLAAFLSAIAQKSDSPATLAWVQLTADRNAVRAAGDLALQRQAELTHDPVERIRFQLNLARRYEAQTNTAAARREVDAVYAANPETLGVVRATVDFDWRNNLRDQAIDTLTRAAAAANASLRTQFTVEAAAKATEAKQFARARQSLEPLLQADPYNAQFLGAMADTWARAGDDAGLRDFYRARIDGLKRAPLPADERETRIAGLRRGLIPALTHLSQFDLAVDQYIELINRYPEDEGLLKEAGAYANDHKLSARLVGYYTKASSDSPRDYRWPMVLARLDTQFENFPGAIQSYERASAVRPERTDLLQSRATLEARLMRFGDASATYRRMYELSYHDAQYLQTVAELAARQGKPDEAVKTLEEAYIAGRPPRAEYFFQVARLLDSWGLPDRALTYAQRAMDLVDPRRPDATNGLDLPLYARLMTEARKSAEAWTKAPSISVAQAVNEFYTPEEKVAFAAFLVQQHESQPATRLAPVAGAAGLLDLETAWDYETAAASPAMFEALSSLEQVQTSRLRFDELGHQLETLARSALPASEPQLRASAVRAYRQAGDLEAEIRVSSGGNLTPEDFRALAASDPPQLIRLAGAAGVARNGATNAAIAAGNARVAMDAVAARGRGESRLWTDALTTLTGLYYADSAPDVTTAFRRLLGTQNIGQQLGHPIDRTSALAGKEWFYYGSRYGEYLAAKNAANPDDYLAAMLEVNPADPAAYSALADSYAERHADARALVEYRHAIELNPGIGKAHDGAALILWSQGNHDDAIKEWRAAIVAYRQSQELKVTESFFVEVPATIRHLGERKLFGEVSPELNALLASYAQRRQNYRLDDLLRPLIESGGLPQALAVFTSGALPRWVLDSLASSEWLSPGDRVVIFRALLASAPTVNFAPPAQGESADSNIDDYRIRLAEALLEAGQPEAARTEIQRLVNTSFPWLRDQIDSLKIRIEARLNDLQPLIEKWRVTPADAPSAASILQAATLLRTRGETAAADSVLSYLYTRELDRGNFDPVNFLGLAGTQLDQGAIPAALATLRRMTLVAGAPFEALIPAADLLEKHQRPEAVEFLEARVKAVPWDAAARLRLARARKSAPELQTLAADGALPYGIRTEAAESRAGLLGITALGQTGAASGLTGELALLARGIITPAEASQHYYYAARLAAAAHAQDAQARLTLLLDAVSVQPGSSDLLRDIFRTAAAAGRDRFALSAIGPVEPQAGPADYAYQTHLREQRVDHAGVALSLEIAAVRQRLGELEPAESALRRLLESGIATADYALVSERLNAIAAAAQLEEENAPRRPAIVGEGIEHEKLVRPRKKAL